MSEFAYPFGLMDPRSPESEISSVDASFFCQREREGGRLYIARRF